jgi:hypothetical protein
VVRRAAGAMERARKRRKLEDILGLRNVSLESIATILEFSGDSGPSRTRTAWIHRFRRFRQQFCDELVLTIPLPQRDGNEPFDWDIVNPTSLFKKYVEASPCLQRALARAPNSADEPWHIVLYADEITPGNISAPDNQRKIVSFYMTFRELGQQLICNTCCWFVLGVLRSKVVKTTEGGLSYVVAALLRQLFMATENFIAGVTIQTENGPTLFFAGVGNILGDEAALKSIYGSKGASGTRVCMNCLKVLKKAP